MEYKSASAATLEVGTKPRNLRVVAMGTCIKSQLAPVALLLAILLCATAPSRPSHSEMDTANEWRDDGQQGDLDKARQASAKLRSHLRSVRVAREQIAPLVAFNDTEPMVTLSLSLSLSLSCISKKFHWPPPWYACVYKHSTRVIIQSPGYIIAEIKTNSKSADFYAKWLNTYFFVPCGGNNLSIAFKAIC